MFLQSIIILEGGVLKQLQKWDGKETTIRRKLADGNLLVVSVLLFVA